MYLLNNTILKSNTLTIKPHDLWGFYYFDVVEIMMKYLILFIAITVSCQNIKPVANKRSIPLSKAEAEHLKKKLYGEHIKSVLSGRSKEMEDQLIKIGDHEMKFDLRFFGSKPEAGWKHTFLCMEGEAFLIR